MTGSLRRTGRPLQARLTVGAVDDPFEREADRTADQVMALLQRAPLTSPHDSPAVEATGGAASAGPLQVSRHGSPPGPPAEIGSEGGELDHHLAARVRRGAGHGAPIVPTVRRSLESAFGHDFSGVRVHADSDVAPRLGASAFTIGSDIHFAPGEYAPTRRSGQWLLSHELTHVVQQTGGRSLRRASLSTARAGGGVAVHRHSVPAIQRHSSHEHYMLGSMTPGALRNVASAKAAAASGAYGNQLAQMASGAVQQPQQLQDALATIREQLVGLDNWRSASPGLPDPATIKKGSTEHSHQWGGQLVTVPCRDGEIVCTLGDLNALPDFFGSFDDLRRVDRSIAFKTFQAIRRETYVALKQLEATLEGRQYTYDRTNEAFAGMVGNKVGLKNPLAITPGFVNAAADVMQTETMLAGDANEVGLTADVGAAATLGRNACHFPPESWLRWRAYHLEARALIASATDANDLAVKANEAIARNAFGEHYLQDSFAAGHLINKGFVMAVAMEHVTAATKKVRGMSDAKIQALQVATKHEAAYALPTAAHSRESARAAGRPVAPNVPDTSRLEARDPQSALEAARTIGRATGDPDVAKAMEVYASGIDPRSKISFEQFRTWLNDFWLQKITNTLHDKYCVKGLEVSSPDKPGLFRIYGDNKMMESAEGTAYTAETSRLSSQAINRLVSNKRNALQPVVQGGPPRIPPRPVPTVDSIVARFPSTVKDDDGTVMPLVTWATGAPMRRKIAELVGSRSWISKEGWKEGKLTGAVRLASPFKPVAAGLGAGHGPF